MIENYNKLKKMAIIERQTYILRELLNCQNKIELEFRRCQTPKKPQEPNVRIRDIPRYNEEIYRVKAKERDEAGESFRHGCISIAYGLLATVIGVFVFWIPLLIAFINKLTSIGKVNRSAYNIYTEECKEIEKNNMDAEQAIRRYNYELQKYEKAMYEYNYKSMTKPARINAYKQQMEQLRQIHQKLIHKQLMLYSSIKLPDNLRSFISPHLLIHYIDSHQAINLDEAKKLLEQNIYQGLVSVDIDHVMRYESLFEKNMGGVIREIKKWQADCRKIKEILTKCYSEGVAEISNNADFNEFVTSCLNNC